MMIIPMLGSAFAEAELVVITKGAPDVLLERCTRVRVGLDVVALDDEMRSRALTDVARLSDEALRSLAIAYRPLAPAKGSSLRSTWSAS